MLPLSEKELDELVARERERGAPPPSLTDWDSLADRLRAEGLIKEKRFGGSGGSSGVGTRVWMQAAAALLLVAGGAAIGRFTAPAAASVNTGSQSSSTTNTGLQTASAGKVGNATNVANTVPEFRSPEE